MNSLIYFEMQADDPERLMHFYGKIFGWEFAKKDAAPVEYWHIHKAGISGGLLKRPTKSPPSGYGTNAFVCSLEVEKFDEVEKAILQNGGMLAMPKFAIPGKCWQGYFIDTDGNTFGLVQVDSNAG